VNPTPSRLRSTAAKELLLKVQMADALDKFRFPGMGRLTNSIASSEAPVGEAAAHSRSVISYVSVPST
jgi:hypothetical protein